MKKASIFSLVFALLLCLYCSENVSASVYAKKTVLLTAADATTAAGACNHRNHVAPKVHNFLPFGNLTIGALKWRLHRWIERYTIGLTRDVVEDSGSSCFMIIKSSGDTILANTYQQDQDSIKYTKCNSTESTVYSISKTEVDRIEGSNGYLFYGRNKFTIKKIGGGIILASTYRRERDSIKYTLNNSSNSTEYGLSIKEVDRIEGSNGYLFYVGDYTSFEYNSLLAFVTSGLAWAAWLGLFSTLGYILAIGLMLASVYFSIASLRLLRRPGLDYGGQWFAYFLDVVAIISNLGLGFLMWALAGYLYL